MKKMICKLLTLLSVTLILNTGYASNCSMPNSNNKNFNIKLASFLAQQQHPRDTTSYWVTANGYYIAFTKDTTDPTLWVYKSNALATNVKNPDPAKKISGATVTLTGAALRVTIGNKMYLFRNMQAANILRYVTVINSTTPSPGNAPANK
jgi:hypothetical protein